MTDDSIDIQEPKLGVRLAVMFHRIGPYHYARLRAAGRRGTVIAIEASARDRTYEWQSVGGAEDFDRRTIFENADADDIKPEDGWRKVHGFLDRAAPDAIAIPGWSAWWALAALHWACTRGVRTVLMSDTHVPTGKLAQCVKRHVVKLFGSAIVGGTPHRDYLADLGVSPTRVFIGYDVIDNLHFSKWNKSCFREPSALGLPKLYFLSVSRFVKKKNLLMLLEAFALYRKQAGTNGCALVLLGDGAERKTIEQRIDELGLRDCVACPGFKQYHELPEFYGLATAFVLASSSEEWGLVVNEAMAASLPVLVSKECGCTHDLVREGINGFAFDPQNPQELAALMLRTAGDEDLRRSMGDASLDLISKWSPQFFGGNLWRAVAAAFENPLAAPTKMNLWLLKALAFR